MEGGAGDGVQAAVPPVGGEEEVETITMDLAELHVMPLHLTQVG